MSRHLERLAYCSRAKASFESLPLIADILAVSQRNNRRDNITGALVYSDGVFFQVVEGERADLDRLLSRLAEDPRHGEIKIVMRSPVAGRVFADWSMAAPRISPEHAPEMKRAVDACDTSPTTAVELLRKLTLKDAIHPGETSHFRSDRWALVQRQNVHPVIARLPIRPGQGQERVAGSIDDAPNKGVERRPITVAFPDQRKTVQGVLDGIHRIRATKAFDRKRHGRLLGSKGLLELENAAVSDCFRQPGLSSANKSS